LKKYIVIIALVGALTFLRSPIFAFGYQAIHGRSVTFASYRFKMPRWYSPMDAVAPMDAATGIYLSAGNSFPSHARFIRISEPSQGMETYGKTQKSVQDGLHAQSVESEQTIQTHIGNAKCFEITLTNGRIEATCRWETEPVLAVYSIASVFHSYGSLT
jgi:hypothetical protein